MIQPGQNARQIADPVAVRILIRPWIDLINDPILPPKPHRFAHFSSDALTCAQDTQRRQHTRYPAVRRTFRNPGPALPDRRTIGEAITMPSPSQPPVPSNPGLRAFARENGLFLTFEKVLGGALRRTRDRTIARRLGTTGLRVGKHPKLEGLACMRIGANLSAGNGLWLHAITHFAGVSYTPVLTIGSDCNLSDQVHIACTHRVTIGSGLLCGSRVVITDHAHGLYAGSSQTSPALRPTLRPLSGDGSVTIGQNVWIGDGCAILPGSDLGDGCILGANSVVNGPIPANTIAAGAPARPIRHWNSATTQWERLSPGESGLPAAPIETELSKFRAILYLRVSMAVGVAGNTPSWIRCLARDRDSPDHRKSPLHYAKPRWLLWLEGRVTGPKPRRAAAALRS